VNDLSPVALPPQDRVSRAFAAAGKPRVDTSGHAGPKVAGQVLPTPCMRPADRGWRPVLSVMGPGYG
jgi:hypothetical protein